MLMTRLRLQSLILRKLGLPEKELRYCFAKEYPGKLCWYALSDRTLQTSLFCKGILKGEKKSDPLCSQPFLNLFQPFLKVVLWSVMLSCGEGPETYTDLPYKILHGAIQKSGRDWVQKSGPGPQHYLHRQWEPLKIAFVQTEKLV